MLAVITVYRLIQSSKDWLIVYSVQNTSVSQVTALLCSHGNYTALPQQPMCMVGWVRSVWGRMPVY